MLKNIAEFISHRFHIREIGGLIDLDSRENNVRCLDSATNATIVALEDCGAQPVAHLHDGGLRNTRFDEEACNSASVGFGGLIDVAGLQDSLGITRNSGSHKLSMVLIICTFGG